MFLANHAHRYLISILSKILTSIQKRHQNWGQERKVIGKVWDFQREKTMIKCIKTILREVLTSLGRCLSRKICRSLIKLIERCRPLIKWTRSYNSVKILNLVGQTGIEKHKLKLLKMVLKNGTCLHNQGLSALQKKECKKFWKTFGKTHVKIK